MDFIKALLKRWNLDLNQLKTLTKDGLKLKKVKGEIMQYQLKARQVCLIIIAFFPILKIFTLPSLLAGFSNEVMWISAIILLLIDFVSILFIPALILTALLVFHECVLVLSLIFLAVIIVFQIMHFRKTKIYKTYKRQI